MADVNVVGAGPNGLAAAVIMARAGLSVEVFEAAQAIGGGTRTAELMQPGHFHDVCSAVHPMALASPFFRAFELSRADPFCHTGHILRLTPGRWPGSAGVPVAGPDGC